MNIKSLALQELISELGDYEHGERIKHDMNYVDCDLNFTEKVYSALDQETINEIESTLPKELKLVNLIGTTMSISGYSTYYNGCEWDSDIRLSIIEVHPSVIKANCIKEHLVDNPELIGYLDYIISFLPKTTNVDFTI